MIKIDLGSSVPIHEQIKARLRELVLQGLLRSGDAVPRAAQFAESLLVSPAIVQRAYQELLKEGFLALQNNVFSVSPQACAQSRQSLAELLQNMVEAVQACRNAGLEWREMESLLRMMQEPDLSRDHMITGILQSAQALLPSASGSHATCPYCRETVENTETATCLLCGTAHHRDCWNETGRCSVFGCNGRLKLPL